jgi:DNA-directed RNA polymerase subunit RPC12/RpoP
LVSLEGRRSMVKRCSRCGYDNRDESRFCSSCGTPLFAAPPMKPVPVPAPPLRSITQPGMCFYHPNLPAIHICSRCGRSICRDCSIPRMGIVLCPECSHRILPPMVPQVFTRMPVPSTLPYHMCPNCGR